ncbi:L,D-transpeptidase [Demequina muriae]|uniref:L,D-transpeptidase n=1 Tax=Demequina muriae TaxID=3051664 RepID=A0ABT8GHL8_9MICO|nr:L,D-transpeptidase [Demequina sp. EGI L300058]MDN4480923.1 L,D-transpeptidase [Demequina sp. EGI L300058]
MPSDASATARPRSGPRHTGTGPSRRSRRWQWAAAVASLVATAVVIAVLLTQGEEPERVTPAAPSPSPSESTPSPSPSEAGPEVEPGEIVLEAGAEGLAVFDSPGGDEPSEELGQWSALGSPTTLMGFDRESVDGEEWIQVELLGSPNHRTGWVRAADATITSTDARIDVYLAEREVELTVDGESSVLSDAVIGEDVSPTPLGVFWVTDVLDFTANPTGVYGAYALGLNGWSETLDEFNGGVPQIAVHGTNQPDLMGQAVSNGCVRLPNEVVTAIAETDGVGVGTPVVVHASREA